jgi:ParB family chromosome partitioning protein
LIACASQWVGDRHFQEVRWEALAALGEGKLDKETTTVFEQAAAGADPRLRTLAVDVLARQEAKKAEKLADQVLGDQVSFRRLAAAEKVDLAAVLHKAAAQVHYQGVAIAELVARDDREGLFAVASDGKQTEAVRLGAIEGLARLADEEAEKRLAELGREEKLDEDLRKAAWRGLRRSQRARRKAETKATTAATTSASAAEAS